MVALSKSWLQSDKNFRIVYANHGKNFQLTDMHFIVLTVNTFYGPPRNEVRLSQHRPGDLGVHLEYVTTP